ncbi:MAG TPA: fused MFS/spermidine synthase [Candidatus Limnocylindrales bacterium]|nr:fused MFS/spermidine synthase [Candidatus Limnocylindrales bacterium]
MRPKPDSAPLPLRKPASAPLQRALLLVLVFVGGFSSLGIEFAASRLLAPYFGQALFVWGILIGLILIYLTIGYAVGGRLADRFPNPVVLYAITGVAAAATGVIPFVSRPILSWSQTGFAQLSVGVVVGSLIAVIVLFAVPVILLGMVSPFAIRLRIEAVAQAGNAAGAVYALSTLGSIAGTFAPVFWLIPSYGTRPTLYVMAIVLAIVSAIGLWTVWWGRLSTLVPPAILILALLQHSTGIRSAVYGQRIYEAESAYNYIQVVQSGQERDLILNEGHAVHSVYDPTTLYTRGPWDDFLLAPLFGSGAPPRSLAVIGLAAGTVARQYTAIDGPLPIDGVELDPKIVEVGRRYFAMREPNLHVTVADGRYWLATRAGRYDVIVVDAYRQPYIPFYLTTREFFQSARAHLNPGGVVAINVGRTQTDYRLVDALSGTLTAVFRHVFIVDTGHGFTNSIIFATDANTTLDTFVSRAQSVANRGLAPIARDALTVGDPRQAHPNGIVFTDELAPVERVIDQIILGYIGQTGR